jgi:UDP-glucose 4-epimerase
MARYLVSGGCGFIGSHLVEALQASGHQVRVLDDLSTGKRHNVSRATELVVGSVTDPTAVHAALKGIDGVFHLAAIASVERSREEWRATHATNLTGWINVLDAVRQLKTAIPLVYASSAAVYGNTEHLPLSETATVRPLTAYGADKLGCELHALVAAAVHKIPTTGLRFFNVYGPRQDPRSPYSGVISVFCDRLRRDSSIEIHGDGQQMRDFIYVEDVVRSVTRAMETCVDGARVFNVCTGIGTSIAELAHLVARQCGVSPKIHSRPPRVGDIRASIGSPLLAREALGVEPGVGMEEGLRRTLAALSAQAPRGGVDTGERNKLKFDEFDVIS